MSLIKLEDCDLSGISVDPPLLKEQLHWLYGLEGAARDGLVNLIEALEDAVEKPAESEQSLCNLLNKDSLLFAELPLSGQIGTIDVSLDLDSSSEEYVHVAYDYMRRPEGYEGDWEVVKSCVEQHFPDAPWVKYGLDCEIDDELTGQSLSSILYWDDGLSVGKFAAKYADVLFPISPKAFTEKIENAVTSFKESQGSTVFSPSSLAERCTEATREADVHNTSAPSVDRHDNVAR